MIFNILNDQRFHIRDLKQPGRVCGRRREKTSEVWVENVVQSEKKQLFKQAPVSARRRSR